MLSFVSDDETYTDCCPFRGFPGPADARHLAIVIAEAPDEPELYWVGQINKGTDELRRAYTDRGYADPKIYVTGYPMAVKPSVSVLP